MNFDNLMQFLTGLYSQYCVIQTKLEDCHKIAATALQIYRKCRKKWPRNVLLFIKCWNTFWFKNLYNLIQLILAALKHPSIRKVDTHLTSSSWNKLNKSSIRWRGIFVVTWDQLLNHANKKKTRSTKSEDATHAIQSKLHERRKNKIWKDSHLIVS